MEQKTTIPEVPAEVVKKEKEFATRRSDWQKVHRKIQRAMIVFYKDNSSFPSYSELAKITGLTVETVYQHMKELDPAQIAAENIERIRMMGDQLYMAIMNTALKGNTTAQQMLLNGAFNNPMGASPLVAQQNNYYSSDKSSPEKQLPEEEVQEIDVSLENLTEIAKFREARTPVIPEAEIVEDGDTSTA